MKSILTSIAANSLLAALAIAADAPPHYTVTDLGPVGGSPGQPYGISNNGLVVGAAAASATKMHAVLWYNRLRIDIGTPGLGGPNSAGFGVNESWPGRGRRRRLQLRTVKTFVGLTPTDFPHSLHASLSCGNSAG